MRKRTRIMSLVLALLMVVGVMPMSVFAINAEDLVNADDTMLYKTPTAEDIFKKLYPSDSVYWTPIYKMSELNSDNKFEISYAEDLGVSVATGANESTSPAAITFPTASSNKLTLNYNATPEKTQSAVPYFEIQAAGNDNTETGCINIAKKNLAGLDFAFTMDITADVESTASTYYDVDITMRGGEGGTVAKRKGNTIYMADGTTELVTLEVGKKVNFSFLVDVGGPTATQSGNTVYYFIDYELVGSANFVTLDKLKKTYDFSAANFPDNEPGFVFNSVCFYYGDRTESGYTIDKFDMYYFDDTPNDGNVGNASRGAKGFAYYNDFDKVTPDAWIRDEGVTDQMTASQYPLVGKFDIKGADLKFVESSDRGTSMSAIEFDETEDQSYIDIYPFNNGTNIDNGANTGKTVILSFDLNPDGGESITRRILQYVERDASEIKWDNSLLYIDPDGTLRTESSTGKALCKIPLYSFTNVTIKVCQSSDVNKYYVYVNGELLNPEGTELFNAAQRDVLTYDGGSVDQFRFFDSKIPYEGITVDNIAVYFADEPVLYELPSYTAPTAEQIFADFYNKDSKYWTPIYKMSELNSDNKFEISYADDLGSSKANADVKKSNPAAITLPKASSNKLTLNYNANPKTAQDGTPYFEIQAAGNNNAQTGCINIAKNNLAGLDFAFTMDITADVESTATSSQNVDITMRGGGGGTVAKRKGNTIYMADGTTELVTLEVGKKVNFSFLVDVGGPTATQSGNTVYYFIDGELVGSAKFVTLDKLKQTYDFSAANFPDNEPGFVFNSLRFYYSDRTKSGYTIDKFDMYYYDDTPDDGDITNAERSAKELTYYNNYDKATSSDVFSDDFDREISYLGAGTIGTKTPKDIRFVDDGRGGTAIQFLESDATEDEVFLTLNAVGVENDKGLTAGKTAIFSFDVNLNGGNFNAGTLASALERSATDGALKSTALVSVDENGVLMVKSTDEGEKLCQLPMIGYTNITVKICQSKDVNRLYVYVNGECANPDGTQFFKKDTLDLLGDVEGLSIDQIRIYQRVASVPVSGVKFDNVTFYYADEPIFTKGENWDKGGYESFISEVFGDYTTAFRRVSAVKSSDYGNVTSEFGNPTGFAFGSTGNRTSIKWSTDENAWYYSPGSVKYNTGTKKFQTEYFDVRLTGSTSYLDTKSKGTAALIRKGLGGRDFVISFAIKPENIKADFSLLSIISPLAVSGNGSTIKPLTLTKTGNIKFNGKLTPIDTNEFTEISLLVDVGGDTIEEAKLQNKIYLFVNGKYIDKMTFLDDTSLNNVYDKSNYADGDYDNYTRGYTLSHIRFEHGGGTKKNASDAKKATYNSSYYLTVPSIYYCDEERAPRPDMFMSFDGYEVGTTASAMPTMDFAQVSGTHVNAVNIGGFKYVSDGNGGSALQRSVATATNTYFQVNATGATNNCTITYSFDVKAGANMPTADNTRLFMVYNNNSSVTRAKDNGGVLLKADGSLTFEYYDGDTMKYVDKVGYINKNSFTNIAIKIDNEKNLAWLYVNGVLVTDPAGLASYSASDIEKFKEVGYKANALRIYQSNTALTDSLIFDNISVRVNSDFKYENLNPLNGIVKGDDGYYYYYENGCVIPNYVSPDGVYTTDETGALTVKRRTAAIDWEKSTTSNILAGSSFSARMQTLYKNTISSNFSSLHVLSIAHHADQIYLQFKDEIKTVPTDVNGNVVEGAVPYVDFTKYDHLEIDLYTEGYQEMLANIIAYAGDGYHGKTPYYHIPVDFGTGAYDGITAYRKNKDGSSAVVSNGTNFRKLGVNGWDTVSINLSENKANGKKNDVEVETKKLIDHLRIDTYECNLKYTFADKEGTAYAINNGVFTFFIKDIYVVDYEKITSLSQLYTMVDGDLVPADESCYEGFYTAESGNVYYYSAETHQRVTDKAAYDVMGNTEVTGYSFDKYGRATVLNGLQTTQDNIQRYYVDGVMLKGSIENDFRVTIGSKDYRINSEGEYLSEYKTASYQDIPYSSYVNPTENIIAGSDFGTGALSALNLQIGGNSSNFEGMAIANKDKHGMASYRFDADGDGDRELVLDVEGGADNYISLASQANHYTDMVYEYDIKLGDDWNGSMRFYLQYLAKNAYAMHADGTALSEDDNKDVVPYYITPDGMLQSNNVNLYQLSANEYTNVAVVLRHYDNSENKGDLTTAGNCSLYYDIYVNGLKVVDNYKAFEGKAYYSTAGIRLTVNHNQEYQRDGKLYFDNMYFRAINDTTGEVDLLPSAKFNGIYNGKYYLDGSIQKGFFKNYEGSAWHYAEEDGTLVQNATEKVLNIPFYDTDATLKDRLVNIDNYVVTIVDGFYAKDETFYIDGILQTESGIYTDKNGVQYYVKADGKVQESGQVTFGGKTYDANDYVLTVRNGILPDADADNAKKYYKDGVAQTGFFKGLESLGHGENVYLTDANGVLLTGKQVVEQDEKRVYDFDNETFVGTKRTDYVKIEELYWYDGYLADGVCFVGENEVETYFVEGKYGTGEIMWSDGTVHKFVDGFRVTEADGTVEDKKPLSITIILQYKTENGVEEIGTRDFYQYWNRPFTYTAPYQGCYEISISKKHGDDITEHDHIIEIENVTQDCVIVVTYDKTKAVHEYETEPYKIDAPTCSAEGTKYFKCVHCTCTATTKCAHCGSESTDKTESIDIVPDAHNYNYDGGIVTVQATCTVNGSTTYKCEHCDYSFTVYTAKAAHSWVEDAENSKAPTCGVNGYTAYKCEDCDATKKVTILATGRHENVTVVTKEATCVVNGYIKETCDECGNVKTTVIPANGIHVYGKHDTPNEILVNASGDQTLIYNCSQCGKVNAVAVIVKAPAKTPSDDDDDV